ncbi:GerAB/ArcD/ProY family transporter [Priestia aryabhattai]|uniref:GerAB/ArcD/ProY family transporter n=1 Tax=Priestia aryabhattai TaxID=412384 RepID=UPI003CF13809
MEKAKISASQLFILMVLFELGSAILLSIGGEAKQDAWIAILLAMVGSFLLFLVFHRLYCYYPHLLPTEYMQKIMGNLIGKVFAFLYIVYFTYEAARILRDFGEMLLTFAYPETPLFIANALLIFVIVYTTRKGIEVIARSGELLFVLMYILATMGFILVVCSGLIDFTNLKPVLEEGLWSVTKVAIIHTLYFPFAEVMVFTMIFPYLKNPKKVKVTGLCALGLSGINLAITMTINVSVLGLDLTSRSLFPLLTTIQSIQVADFLERLDVFFMIALIINGFFKIIIYFYAAVISSANLFRIKFSFKLSASLGMVVLFVSLIVASNIQEHIYEGKKGLLISIHLCFQIIIPLLLLIVAFLKNKKRAGI